ncbi:anhydro-N-acetylmuramic acid kinase [Sediminibacillus albus]|uniref:Anhydro-N-acetylmuramic acid kinase n=1 Tax=Sediminibacillus albus TaxID=407036 RepID=A0A1G8YM29_9BACI|nr:anhydro-N-acetylmuramic acid kinase [Sediminibacillus albus]SDK03195.1 anhydro-N-acetylmuramic acid kinase [Sediminibacillus albus]
MEKHLGIGLMSGTSLDGIDAVLVEISGKYTETKVNVIDSLSFSFPKELREELKELCSPLTASLENICSMNMYLGKEMGKIVNDLLVKANKQKEDVLYISSHGQTIYHNPAGGKRLTAVPGTLQIGDLSVLSEVTGITAVGDFRTADMAAGGQGAPLVSFVDYILFKSEKYSRAIQNIGGIGNVTYLPKDGTDKDVQSFDTGPGNMVIDEVVTRISNGKENYDKDGKLAFQGNINTKLLNKLLDHPYLVIEPPKTTGRELFGADFVDKVIHMAGDLPSEDIVSTVTAWSARTIADSYQRFLEVDGNNLDEVIIGGGGSYNPFLMKQIKENLPEKNVYTHEHFGISSDLKEAVAFAVLGYHCLQGQYNQSPSATGAKNPVIMGKVAYTQPGAYKRVFSWRGN